MYYLLAVSHGAAAGEGVKKEIESFRKWKGLRKLPD
jgi:hypothetical protein